MLALHSSPRAISSLFALPLAIVVSIHVYAQETAKGHSSDSARESTASSVANATRELYKRCEQFQRVAADLYSQGKYGEAIVAAKHVEEIRKQAPWRKRHAICC